MDVLLMGLSIFAVILASFFVLAGITKGAFFLIKRKNSAPLHSNWVHMQVDSGDDSLGHPDLKRISELRDI